MRELILNPWFWFVVFLAGWFAFPFFYCVRLAKRIPPEEVPELPIEEFLKVRKCHKRSYLAEAFIMFIIIGYVPSDMTNFAHQNLNRILLASGCVLFVFSLIHRFRTGKILKAHGLKWFHFDSLIWKKAMKGIE